MVVNGACEADWPQVSALALQFPGLILPSFGYHPWYIGERTPGWLAALETVLDGAGGPVGVGVGEIGLDRWKPGLPYDGQEEVFLAQLEIAASRNLPVSIHCLQAWGRMLELLRGHHRPARGFLLHSYGGSREMVPLFAELGAYFSFPGYFAHPRKERQRAAFKGVPLDRLLVETDAPDQLPPDSLLQHRVEASGGVLNHPANLGAIQGYLADMLGLAHEDLARRVQANFDRLFQPGHPKD